MTWEERVQQQVHSGASVVLVTAGACRGRGRGVKDKRVSAAGALWCLRKPEQVHRPGYN
jgi:hypothetical protein